MATNTRTAQTLATVVSIALCITIAATGCGRLGFRTPSDQVYTLYRVGGQFKQLRVRVATFDEPNDEQYNRVTCEEVRELEQASVERVPGFRYWCEKGYYRP